MRVFCINGEGWNMVNKNDIYPTFGPTYSEICTVESSYEEDGKLWYNLLEYPDPEPSSGYLSSAFIPISEQEEEVAAEIQILELTK